MKTSHESLGTSAENLAPSDIDGIQLVRDFCHRLALSAPNEPPNVSPKPANRLSKEEVDYIREILERFRGVRHLTSRELDCSITWLDEVITTHKLEKNLKSK